MSSFAQQPINNDMPSTPNDNKEITLPIVWKGFADLEAKFANAAYVSNMTNNEFVLVFAQIQSFSPEQTAGNPPETVDAHVNVKLVLTPDMMRRLIFTLATSYEAWKKRHGVSE